MSVPVVLGAAMVASAVPLAWWSVGGRPSRRAVNANLRRGLEGPTDLRTLTLERSSGERVFAPLMTALARHGRRFTPAGALDRLEVRVIGSGLQHRWPIERVLAVKAVLGAVVALLLLTRFAGAPSAGSLVFAAVVTGGAWFLPDTLLGGRMKERQKAVQLELPDTIDQVTIAVEAGLGFEAALARAASAGTGPLASEIARTLQDIQIGVARTEALEGLAERTDLADLRHFVTAIRQAEKYGLPIANTLRIQSAELREKRRQRAEERAMKIPVKILLPLVFCILPTLFLVILGPAAIRITNNGGVGG